MRKQRGERAGADIKYGEANNERINVAHLELAMRMPMEYLPDPRTVIEDAQDREKEERDAEDRRKRGEEERMIQEAQRLARKEDKRKKRERILEARAAGEDVESLASSTLYSEKSGSKKSGTKDGKSVQSPTDREGGTDKSKTHSERQSMGKGASASGSDKDEDEDDEDLDDDQKEESIDDIAELPS